ncbi:uncharacterized protein BX663DRAFT_488972 [Cokeromyces recurvatus]|uniref:uncharacterized protein n=1 Tax=Cokeromyces recurvatus TaxID=90255 RepID=UPI0022205CD7|nr:uncharacterized protein BX663DRAFT_488972 [Cokeromyces recurvatus]KAI7899744.1 hypothetical protein BX663DRAFT_488972 [Cokeromyces recurvatus]
MYSNYELEIFQLIVSCLSDKDIATCQSICSLWYKKWVRYRYSNVYIRGEHQFRSFFYYNLETSLYGHETMYSIGYQVQKLVIERVFMHDGVIASKGTYRMPFEYYQQYQKRKELDKVKNNFLLWKDMQTLVEFNGITVTCFLLQQQPTQLTSLFIQFNNQNDLTNQKISLINLLHHAPQLKSLTFEKIYLSITELEKIHENCPQLMLLNILDTILLTAELSLLSKISPAINLHSFRFVNSKISDDVFGYMNYIAQKYTRIKTLEIENSCLPFKQEESKGCDSIRYQIELLKIAKQCKKLRALKIQPFVLNDIFLRLLDENDVCLSQLSFGDSFDVNSLIYELDSLVKSNQRHYINHLTIDCRRLLMRGSDGLDQNMTVSQNDTTQVISKNDEGKICLENILNYCPNLISLVITHAKIIIASKSCSTPTSTSTFTSTTIISNNSNFGYGLQTLKLEHVSLDNDNPVFPFISTYCKALRYLSCISIIPTSSLHESSNNNHTFDIYLPNHHLNILVLEQIRVSSKCNARLGTSRFKIILGNTCEAYWYDLTGYTNPSFFPNHHDLLSSELGLNSRENRSETQHTFSSSRMHATKFKKTKDAIYKNENEYISITCKSIRALYLNGLRIF